MDKERIFFIHLSKGKEKRWLGCVEREEEREKIKIGEGGSVESEG